MTVNKGLFNVQLDFGASAFTGNNRWIGTAVRCPTGAGSFTELLPRQPMTAVPYAISAGTAEGSRGDFMVNGGLTVSGTGVFGGADSDGALFSALSRYMDAQRSRGPGRWRQGHCALDQ